MLKIGQNWGEIVNYPPQCSIKICTPALNPLLSCATDSGFTKLKTMLTVYETTIHLNIKMKKGHAKNEKEKNDSRRVLVWNP